MGGRSFVSSVEGRRKALALAVITVVLLALGAGVALAAYPWGQVTSWSGSQAASRSRLASGDFNGDGKTDALTLYDSGSGRSAIYVFRSNGSTFSRAVFWSGALTATRSKISATDYNGDGKCDLLVLYDLGNGTSCVYSFRSTGTSFVKSTMWQSARGRLYWSRAALVAGDMNADQRGDAIIQYDLGSGKLAFYTLKGASATVRGSVRNAVGGGALAGVTVTVYSSTGSVAGRGTSAADGSYVITVPPGSGQRVVFGATGYRDVEYFNVATTAGAARYLETVRMVDSTTSGTGLISGTIANAFTGQGVDLVTVTLRAGVDARTGTVVAATSSGAGGAYSIAGLTPGVYTAELAKTDWSTSYFTVVCIANTNTSTQNGTITPRVASGQVRVVLTWGSSPSDLDSHMAYYPAGSTARSWHVYYGSKLYPAGSATPQTALDVDDTSAYGPETTTIYQQAATGTYRFSVYDYTHSGQAPSSGDTQSSLAASGAKVQVYNASGLIATYNVPGGSGGLWKVFEIRNGTLVPINSISVFSGGSANVP